MGAAMDEDPRDRSSGKMTETNNKTDFMDEFIDAYSSMTDQERLEEAEEMAVWDTALTDGLEDKTDDRYQHQTWLVRCWRRRHYFAIPFVAFRIWRSEQTRELQDEHDWRLSFKNSWRLATGLAQGKMKWFYYSSELGYDFSDKEDLTSDEE
jgi:hypothetical protein